MLVECVAVIIIIALTGYSYLRAKKPNIAMSIFPLAFVPILYLVGIPLSKLLYKLWNISAVATTSFCVLLGAVSACCIFGYFSTKLYKKSSKMFYNVCCSGFTVIFAWLIIMKII